MENLPQKRNASAQVQRTEGEHTQSNSIEVPKISLPKGGGAIKGIDEKFEVNAANGTASLSLPLPFSAGRNGFMPSISLGYNSGGGNGLFGLGWDLGFPSIQRKTDKKLPRYHDSEESDIFMFSGVEDLVADTTVLEIEPDGYKVRRYHPRIEGGFSKIERITHPTHGMWWKVTTRDNIVTFFGKSPKYRIADPADQNRVFQWLPELSFDDKGNCVLYEFKAEDGKGYGAALQDKNRFDANGTPRFVNRYLKRVYYTKEGSFKPDHHHNPQNPASSDFLMELVLDYGEHGDLPANTQGAASVNYEEIPPWPIRHDAFSTYRSGFEIRTARLCRRVLMFHHFEELGGGPCLVRSLDLQYRDWTQKPKPEEGKKMEATYLVSAIQRSYVKEINNNYRFKSLPPLEFEYQELCWSKDIQSVAPEDVAHAPAGLSSGYQWVDLYNEGIAGILTEQGNGWFYKENLGGGHFTEAKPVIPKPSFLGLSNGVLQIQDLAADGRKQVVVNSRGLNGYFELKEDAGAEGSGNWENFRAFEQIPNVNLRDPNTRLLDLNGDGQPEIVITEENVFTWYPSAGTLGYDAPELAPKPYDEEQGSAIVFADSTQSIYLADMSGDGLTDIVRIRNGQVCYWPNLGYGRFGAKVNMGNAPWFDHPDQFNPAYLQLADISGTGATDIIYLGKNQFLAWLNLSGNVWSEACDISPFPDTAQPNAVTVTDLLGNGTSCIVWSSPLPAHVGEPLRYIDLMSGQKPHILKSYRNNFGKKVAWTYKSSTHYYLEDKKAGKPWITKLPFPVQVVSQVAVTDQWRKSTFANTYSYHHGYYDHAEREFRGFGRVEQVDVEDFGKFVEGNGDSPYITDDKTLYQPPVKTVTWFHTGAFMGRERILSQFREEYFQPKIEDFTELELPEPAIENKKLSADEWREALRACKGMTLRQEVYELDVDALQQGEQHPVKLFSTAFHNCWIRCLQPKGKNQHAVFLVGESEAITYQYELDLRAYASASEGEPKVLDPRIAHTLNLNFDKWGQPLQSVAVAYARNQAAIAKMENGEAKEFIQRSGIQSVHHIAYTENRYTTDEYDEDTCYRLPLPCEVLTYELTGAGFNLPTFTIGDFRKYRLSEVHQTAGDAVGDLDYHRRPDLSKTQKRLVEQVRMLYFDTDLKNPLDYKNSGRLALPYETYKLALTNDLLSAILGEKLPSLQAADEVYGDMLQRVLGEGGYHQFDDEPGLWWIRSGIAGFAEDAADHFYLPERYTDPFGHVTTLEYNDTKTLRTYDLFFHSSTDPVGNRVDILRFDFRVLAPLEMQDINGNRSEVCFDTLGMPAAVAVKGKGTEGDNLEGISTDISEADLIDFFTGDYDPDKARAFLGNATARHLYYLGDESHPACAAGLVREKHVAQLAAGESSPLQAAFEYSDGMGNVLVKKSQAEPEKPGEPLRWIASGKTVLNNKGKPVKQYEPYFSTDENETPNHRFEEPREEGVTPILYYDAPGRQVRVEMPDGTLSRVEFSPWFTRAYDANDTVLESRWLQETGKIPSDWEYAKELSPNVDAQKRAAFLAILHANTPTETHLDSLGREVLAIAHNCFRRPVNNHFEKTEEKYLTYTHLDTEGKALWIQDARGNIVMRYTLPASTGADPLQDFCPAYDLAGNLLYQHSMDAGDRWMLPDTAGQPLYAWDVNDRWENGEAIEERRIYHNTYDELRRPKEQYLRINDDPSQLLIEQTIYGEKCLTNATDRNLRGQIRQHYDPSGLITNQRFDFKGNLLEQSRQLAQNYEAPVIDWSPDPTTAALEAEVFTQCTEYDALNRMTRQYNWHRGTGSRVAVYEPKYNERGLLAGEDLIVGANKTDGGYSDGNRTTAIFGLAYDPKGQKQCIRYGNGTTTRYTYDTNNFRLIQLRTTRSIQEEDAILKDSTIAQDLYYTYDPSGNITEISDEAIKTKFYNNQEINARSLYEYDAQYQLISATGRENNALDNKAPGPKPEVAVPIGELVLRNYTQYYTYDCVGNILRMRHKAGLGNLEERWTRYYQYAKDSNRLLATQVGDPGAYELYTDKPTLEVKYHYDTHGSMLNFSNVEAGKYTRWDYRDMIHSVDLEGGGMAWYQYAADKQRCRKVIQRNGNTREERWYLGGLEWYRRFDSTGVVEEIETLHLFEGEQRVLLVEDVLVTPDDKGPNTLFRYQYSNHLGSSCVEMDQEAEIISYEEYHPYGTTAYHAVNAAIKAAAKRYRYTGMERDEETGLAYHTARYYLAWLGRWGSCDPIEIVDYMKVYVYCCNAPMMNIDKNGEFSEVVHGALTYHLALSAGFKEEDAAKIALATASVDHDPEKIAVNARNVISGRTTKYHFPTFQKAIRDINLEIALGEKMSLSEFGFFLHSLEDVGFEDALGPHKRGGGLPDLAVPGHGSYYIEQGGRSTALNNLTDQVPNNPQANKKVLEKIYNVLKQAAGAYYGEKTNSDDEAAFAAIDTVIAANTSDKEHDFFDRDMSFNGKNINSYTWWVDNNKFHDVYKWESKEIDYSMKDSGITDLILRHIDPFDPILFEIPNNNQSLSENSTNKMIGFGVGIETTLDNNFLNNLNLRFAIWGERLTR